MSNSTEAQPQEAELLLDQMWEALKTECCKLPPDEAKMVVFLSEDKFRKAMAQFATARADLPRTTADADALSIAINSCKDVTTLGRFAASVDPVRWVAELQAHLETIAPRAAGETTVEAAAIAIKATADVYDYVGPLLGTKIDDTLVRFHIFSIIERHVHGPVLLMPDNGHCTICGGFRLYDTRSHMQPCENPDCLSRRVEVILKDYEAPSHETLERIRQRCMAQVRARTEAKEK